LLYYKSMHTQRGEASPLPFQNSLSRKEKQ